MKPVTLTSSWVRRQLPPRPASSHKGSTGHVLVVAGSRGMTGAATLCSLGALCSGAGLLTAALPASERLSLTSQLPEALTMPLPDDPNGHWMEDAVSILERYMEERRVSVLAIGPGLSVRPAVGALVLHALRVWRLPLVLDADGLNNIQADDLKGRENLVITPHPGEFARLFKKSPEDVAAKRCELTLEMAKKYKLVCVLKGHRSVISDGRALYVNPTGNPAMASGGMGDVLTGIIASLLGQKLSPLSAACAGVYLHGLSADLAAVSDRGLLASDVARGLPQALRKIGVR